VERVVKDHHRWIAALPGFHEEVRHKDGLVRPIGVVVQRKVDIASVAVLVQVLRAVELGHPVDADKLDCHDSKNVSNRGKKTN
jgi:hypothetical protein